jgi:DNA repair protein RadA
VKDFKLTDLDGVGPVTLKKLKDAGIITPLDIVVRGTKEFSRESGLSVEKSEKHMTKLKTLLAEDGNDIEIKNVASLRALRKRQIKTKLNVEELDKMFKGGIETQSLYEIYGSEGCGKTQMSMSLAAESLGNGHGVMFIDCEATFDLDRFAEICESRGIEIDEDKLGYHMYGDSTELITGIKNMTAELIERDTRYLIIDGLVGLMRLGYEGRGELYERQNELETVLKYLRNLAILLNIGVIITNQVVSNPDPFGAKEKPIGGHVVGHYVKYIISITKGLKNNRVAKLVKAPNSPTAEYAFYLNEEGVSSFEKFKEKAKKKKMDDIAEDTQGLIDKSLLVDEPVEKVKVY